MNLLLHEKEKLRLNNNKSNNHPINEVLSHNVKRNALKIFVQIEREKCALILYKTSAYWNQREF